MSSKLRTTLIALGLAFLLAAPAFAFVPTYADRASVLGKGNMNLIFSLEALSDPGRDAMDLKTTFNYGFNEAWDFWANLPFRLDSDHETGVMDLTLGARWLFDKKVEWSMALAPYLTLPTGDEDKFLGYGKVNLGAIFIASWAKAPWAVDINVDFYTVNVKNADNDTGYTLAAGGEYALDQLWTLLAQLSFEKYADLKQNYLLGGAAYEVSEKVELKFGYKSGLNDDAIDSTLLLGATIKL